MQLLLFHGGEILAFLGGGFLGLGLFVGMLVWALRGPAKPWLIPVVYLIIGLAISIPVVYTDDIFFGLSVMFAFPWSILLVVVSTMFDRNVGPAWLIPFIFLNAAIVYLIARYQSRIT